MHETSSKTYSGGFRGAERRRFKRVPVLRPATYRDAKFGETKSLILDLSEGGAYVESPVVPEGSRIEMEFNLVDGYRVQVVAVVRYLLLGTGMGVEFKQISDQDRRRIAAFVETFPGAALHQ